MFHYEFEPVRSDWTEPSSVARGRFGLRTSCVSGEIIKNRMLFVIRLSCRAIPLHAAYRRLQKAGKPGHLGSCQISTTENKLADRVVRIRWMASTVIHVLRQHANDAVGRAAHAAELVRDRLC
jgi:hypothetical protein